MLRHFLLFFSILLLTFIANPAIFAQEQQATKEEKKVSKNDTESTKGESVNKTVEIPMPLSLEQIHKSDINHYFQSDEVKTLLAGPNDFITLIKESVTSNNKGVVILLADWQQTAITPKGLNYLRTEMPNQGWTTISIQPPNMPENYPSKALKLAERQEENHKIITAYQQNLSAIMTRVMEKAKNYPGIFVVIVAGSHGAILTDLYQQGKNSPPNAFIVLSSYMYTKAAN